MTRLELLRERRKLYLQAEYDIVHDGQTVELEGLKLSRANLGQVRKELHNIENEIADLEYQQLHKRPRSRLRIVVPIE